MSYVIQHNISCDQQTTQQHTAELNEITNYYHTPILQKKVGKVIIIITRLVTRHMSIVVKR